ncbi:MAG: hypothetical protein L5655_10660 [Thermosediminibacteraceae bacterium]|nr:hypothetical protein [Thermosediminibacteraceae bacterium]
MDAESYLDMLCDKLKAYFDLENRKVIAGYTVDLFGRCHIRHVRTFLTPGDVIEAYETNEYFVVKVFEKLTGEDLDSFGSFLKREVMKAFVEPKDGHMCSIINGVLVVKNGMPEKLKKPIRKYAFEKSFLFSLKGWCRINLAAVDLKNKNVIFSRKSRNLEKLLKP